MSDYDPHKHPHNAMLSDRGQFLSGESTNWPPDVRGRKGFPIKLNQKGNVVDYANTLFWESTKNSGIKKRPLRLSFSQREPNRSPNKRLSSSAKDNLNYKQANRRTINPSPELLTSSQLIGRNIMDHMKSKHKSKTITPAAKSDPSSSSGGISNLMNTSLRLTQSRKERVNSYKEQLKSLRDSTGSGSSSPKKKKMQIPESLDIRTNRRMYKRTNDSHDFTNRSVHQQAKCFPRKWQNRYDYSPPRKLPADRNAYFGSTDITQHRINASLSSSARLKWKPH